MFSLPDRQVDEQKDREPKKTMIKTRKRERQVDIKQIQTNGQVVDTKMEKQKQN